MRLIPSAHWDDYLALTDTDWLALADSGYFAHWWIDALAEADWLEPDTLALTEAD